MKNFFSNRVVLPVTNYSKYSDKKKKNNFDIDYKVFDDIIKNINLENEKNLQFEHELNYKFDHRFNKTTVEQNQYIQMFLIKRLSLKDLKSLIYIILEFLNEYRITYYSILVSNYFTFLKNQHFFTKNKSEIFEIYQNYMINALPRFNGYQEVTDKNILLNELLKFNYSILAIGLSKLEDYNNQLGIEFNREMDSYINNNPNNIVNDSNNVSNTCNNKNSNNQDDNLIKNVCPIIK